MADRRIALFMNDGANDYQVMQRRDCQEAARRHDFTLSVHSADNDSDTQLRQIRSALDEPAHRRPCALLVSPVHEVSLIGLAYEAARLGVAWVLMSRWFDAILDLRRQFPSVPVFSTTPDQFEAGRIQGQQVRMALTAGVEILCIRGPLGTSTTPKRAAGLDQELRDCPQAQRTYFNGDWSLESGQRIMHEWLRPFHRGSPPKFMLASQNDSMAMGARQVLLDWMGTGGRSAVDAIPIFGCNGSPEYGQRLVRSGELAATVIIPSVAGPAVEAMASFLAGHGLPHAEIKVRVHSFPDLPSLAERYAPDSATGSPRPEVKHTLAYGTPRPGFRPA